ncbi:hypothetical protein Esti_005518 [Eimeria stiedai]
MRPAAGHALLQQRRPTLLRRQFSAAAFSTSVSIHFFSRRRQHQQGEQQLRACSVPPGAAPAAAAAAAVRARLAVEGTLLLPSSTSSWHAPQLLCFRSPVAFYSSSTSGNSNNSHSNRDLQGLQSSFLTGRDEHLHLQWQQARLLQQQQQLQQLQQLQQQQQRLLTEISRQRRKRQEELVLPVLQRLAEATVTAAASLPAKALDLMLPSVQSVLLRLAAAAANEQHATVRCLLEQLSQDLSILNSSRHKEGSEPGEPQSRSSHSNSDSKLPDDGSSRATSRKSNSSSSSNSSRSDRDMGNDGGGPGKPADSTTSIPRRIPMGFEHFYPKQSPKQHDGKDSTSSSNSSSSSNSGRMPFMPPSGGALQHQLLRMCVWLGFWVFALSLLSRVVEPQLSLQEFLSSYVARGLVEKVVVVGDKGRCTAVVRAAPTPQQLQEMQHQQQQHLMLLMQQVQQQQQASPMQHQQQQQPEFQQQQQQQQLPYHSPQQQPMQQNTALMQSQLPLLQQQQPKLTDMLPRKHIVRFKTGLNPESFIEKMEHFQASLGIHPKDFLPIYVEEGWTFNIGEFLASAFFFLIMASIARDVLAGGAMNRGGSTSGLNRLLGNSSSKRARIKADTVRLFRDTCSCCSSGLHEAKREIMEFVAFLKNPVAFQKMGAKLPRGALLVGPPGTGKTLLAKAVAGEAGVPFFSISGSDFVELFVGVGASRVRELFDEARKAAPSIIWIDEIDSVGASRSSQFANSEREQTLNQLLVEMDGFAPHQSVVVLAGTNREDLLDAALRRAGRFDRRVQIGRPDVKERCEIFKVHLKPLKLSPEIDPDALAERMAALTPGMASLSKFCPLSFIVSPFQRRVLCCDLHSTLQVGADIANVCNESAIYAARRRTKRGIEQRDFEMAIERIIAGLPSNTKSLMSSKQRLTIAFHESGHAVAGWFLKHADVVLKLTIIPRDSGAMGFSQQMPPPVELYEKDALLDRIAVCLAGRAAEELYMGCISSGAVDDIEKATHLARLIVMQLGMNDKIGLVNLRKNQQTMQEPYPPFSDATAKLVDDEVRALISQQYERVKALLTEKEQEVRALSSMLLEKESLTFADLQDCLGVRPYPPDAQLAAYINALPTRALPPPPDDPPTGAFSAKGDHEDSELEDRRSEGKDGSSSNTGGHKAASSSDKQRKQRLNGDENGDSDDFDKGDDKDDDDQGPSGGPRKKDPKRKLFGGDDDSCLPELLRKNLQPKTPAPSAAAQGTDIRSTG